MYMLYTHMYMFIYNKCTLGLVALFSLFSFSSHKDEIVAPKKLKMGNVSY
uniref:Uncharacterized protein n=1 Tax=Amphimedon queenslandica TaxID=400682 RepID=A0A1X7TMW6_AMPQE